ncbi:hypothetical protein D3C86_2112620 [compost metagenome]
MPTGSRSIMMPSNARLPPSKYVPGPILVSFVASFMIAVFTAGVLTLTVALSAFTQASTRK